MHPPLQRSVRRTRPSTEGAARAYEPLSYDIFDNYHNELVYNYSFGAHAVQFDLNDGAFLDYATTFAIDTIGKVVSLDLKTRSFYWPATILGQGALHTYKVAVPIALKYGLEAEKIRELVYQSASAIGISRAYPFLATTMRLFEAAGIPYEEDKRWSHASEARATEGKRIARELHAQTCGHDPVRAKENYPWLAGWLEEDLYGTFYAREELSLEEREGAMFCMMASLGVGPKTLEISIRSLINLGVPVHRIVEIATSNLPFIGYVRLVNILQTIDDVRVGSD